MMEGNLQSSNKIFSPTLSYNGVYHPPTHSYYFLSGEENTTMISYDVVSNKTGRIPTADLSTLCISSQTKNLYSVSRKLPTLLHYFEYVDPITGTTQQIATPFNFRPQGFYGLHQCVVDEINNRLIWVSHSYETQGSWDYHYFSTNLLPTKNGTTTGLKYQYKRSWFFYFEEKLYAAPCNEVGSTCVALSEVFISNDVVIQGKTIIATLPQFYGATLNLAKKAVAFIFENLITEVSLVDGGVTNITFCCIPYRNRIEGDSLAGFPSTGQKQIE